MYEELVKKLRYLASVYSVCNGNTNEYYRRTVEAADAIEELQSVVEHYAEVCVTEIPKWIPVEERLPEEDERVLVVAHRINDNSPVVSIDSVEADDGELRFSLYRGVDYWMPLPDPPKEDIKW